MSRSLKRIALWCSVISEMESLNSPRSMVRLAGSGASDDYIRYEASRILRSSQLDSQQEKKNPEQIIREAVEKAKAKVEKARKELQAVRRELQDLKIQARTKAIEEEAKLNQERLASALSGQVARYKSLEKKTIERETEKKTQELASLQPMQAQAKRYGAIESRIKGGQKKDDTPDWYKSLKQNIESFVKSNPVTSTIESTVSAAVDALRNVPKPRDTGNPVLDAVAQAAYQASRFTAGLVEGASTIIRPWTVVEFGATVVAAAQSQRVREGLVSSLMEDPAYTVGAFIGGALGGKAVGSLARGSRIARYEIVPKETKVSVVEVPGKGKLIRETVSGEARKIGDVKVSRSKPSRGVSEVNVSDTAYSVAFKQEVSRLRRTSRLEAIARSGKETIAFVEERTPKTSRSVAIVQRKDIPGHARESVIVEGSRRLRYVEKIDPEKSMKAFEKIEKKGKDIVVESLVEVRRGLDESITGAIDDALSMPRYRDIVDIAIRKSESKAKPKPESKPINRDMKPLYEPIKKQESVGTKARKGSGGSRSQRAKAIQIEKGREASTPKARTRVVDVVERYDYSRYGIGLGFGSMNPNLGIDPYIDNVNIDLGVPSSSNPSISISRDIKIDSFEHPYIDMDLVGMDLSRSIALNRQGIRSFIENRPSSLIEDIGGPRSKIKRKTPLFEGEDPASRPKPRNRDLFGPIEDPIVKPPTIYPDIYDTFIITEPPIRESKKVKPGYIDYIVDIDVEKKRSVQERNMDYTVRNNNSVLSSTFSVSSPPPPSGSRPKVEKPRFNIVVPGLDLLFGFRPRRIAYWELTNPIPTVNEFISAIIGGRRKR